jgi:hypothetical protein
VAFPVVRPLRPDAHAHADLTAPRAVRALRCTLTRSLTGASALSPHSDWNKFPAAWFGGNATNFESDEQLAEIGKYSLAILGWQHLISATNWTASVYAQIEQARLLKAKFPQLPVYVYTGFGNADGYNNHTWEVMRGASDGCPANQPCRVTPSPYTDWFLQAGKTPVYSMSACEQMGLGYSHPPTDKCWNPIWNVANPDVIITLHPAPPAAYTVPLLTICNRGQVRDFYVDKVIAPLASSKHIDGVSPAKPSLLCVLCGSPVEKVDISCLPLIPLPALFHQSVLLPHAGAGLLRLLQLRVRHAQPVEPQRAQHPELLPRPWRGGVRGAAGRRARHGGTHRQGPQRAGKNALRALESTFPAHTWPPLFLPPPPPLPLLGWGSRTLTDSRPASLVETPTQRPGQGAHVLQPCVLRQRPQARADLVGRVGIRV